MSAIAYEPNLTHPEPPAADYFGSSSDAAGLTGHGAPSALIGTAGQTYVDLDTGDLYWKSAVWNPTSE